MDIVNRLGSAIVLAAFMILLILFRGPFVIIGILIFGCGGMYEMWRALKNAGRKPLLWPGLLWVILTVPVGYWLGDKGLMALIFVCVAIALATVVFESHYTVDDAQATLLVMLYSGCPVMAMYMLDQIPDPQLASVAVASALVIPVMSDLFSYFSGRLFGKHPLTTISPKKTVEGFVGGAVITVIGAVVMGMIFAALGNQIMPLWQFGLLGVGGALMAPVGDLSASAIKRFAGIKDYGHVFKGHGGFLDRLDSIFMSIIAVFVVMTALGAW